MLTTAPVAARVTHMITLPVLVDLLVPPYAQAHNCLEEEVREDFKRGLTEARLTSALCASIWEAVKKTRPGEQEAELIEKLAKAMTKSRRATPAPDRVLDKMSAVFTAVDANIGRASDVARQALESTQGKVMLEKSVAATGDYLASRLMPVKS